MFWRIFFFSATGYQSISPSASKIVLFPLLLGHLGWEEGRVNSPSQHMYFLNWQITFWIAQIAWTFWMEQIACHEQTKDLCSNLLLFWKVPFWSRCPLKGKGILLIMNRQPSFYSLKPAVKMSILFCLVFFFSSASHTRHRCLCSVVWKSHHESYRLWSADFASNNICCQNDSFSLWSFSIV